MSQVKAQAFNQRACFGSLGGAALWALALLAVFVVSLVAVISSPAKADQSRIGAIDPKTKLPGWLADETGLRLKPVVGADRERVTYWSATATMPTNNGGTISLLLSTRGNSQDQRVSSRIHISADNLEPGATYRVIHPYGSETFTDVDGGRRGIDFTEEIGCLQAPCEDFSAVLNGRVNPWLTWDTLGMSKDAPPEGSIGDPSTPHEVSGSPAIDENGEPQNYFEIKGPNIGGPGVDVVRTELFAVEGRISGLTAFADPKSGSHDTGQPVTLTASDPEGEIFYTTDGAEPTADSTPYEKPIPITEKTTLKFIVVVPDGPAGKPARSPVLTAIYTPTGLDLP